MLTPEEEGGGVTIRAMPQTGQLSYEDLLAFPNDGVRRELIDGELIESPSPRTRHQQIVLRLAMAIGGHLEASSGGEVFIAPLDILFSNTDVVEPDLFFVAADRSEIVTEKNIQGVPSLVVEVLSDPRLDRVRKRDLYATFGVPEYWVVDPDADRIEVHRLHNAAYGKPELFEANETLSTPLLPGLVLVLDRIFAR